MKSLVERLAHYAEYHRDKRNIATHFVGIPMILVGTQATLARIGIGPINAAVGATGLAARYYRALDPTYGAAMAAVLGATCGMGTAIAAMPLPLWAGATAGLIVEDDPWSQRIVADVLEMAGHSVITAVGVVDARDQLREKPELVLLDIHIPGGGGELLLREIRADDGLRKIPVIALTASAMAGDLEHFLRQGFTGYLSKPIDVRAFATTIEGFLR